MGLFSWLRSPSEELEERSAYGLSLDDWASFFTYNGGLYPLSGLNQTLSGQSEEIGRGFEGYVAGAYKTNGVVFACMLVRLLLFSEARFQFRQRQSGRPGDLFGTNELGILETPGPNQTTGDLLTRAIQDADIAGNWFAYRDRDRIYRLRPDWVDIIIGSENEDAQAGDPEAEIVGYVYHPGGRTSGREARLFLRDEVAHFAPIPDPVASFRGMSWLTPVLSEISSDKAATDHKLKFFENGATPNMVVKFDVADPDKFQRWSEKFREGHEGSANAYKTLLLGAGADATVVGTNLRQIDFKSTQGAGETRIAAAAGVPPVIVGLSEGLQAATYSNYGQARRRFADGTMRPLWRGIAAALAPLINVPGGAELWYDDRDIPFLAEDVKDAADTQQVQAIAIKQLTDAGFTADSVVEAITSGDLKRLVHSGLFSVQLQPPGTQETNGNVEPRLAQLISSLR